MVVSVLALPSASSSVCAALSPLSLADSAANQVRPAKNRKSSRSTALTPAKRSQKTLSPEYRSAVSQAAPRTVSTSRSSLYFPEGSEAPEAAVASSVPASLASAPTPLLYVPLAVIRTPADPEVARYSRHTQAVRQSLDITFYRSGMAHVGLKLMPIVRLSAWRISMDGRGRGYSRLYGCSSSMVDVSNPSHPCQVTLDLFLDSSMFVAAARLLDARATLLSYKRYLRTRSVVDAVCDVWNRYSGVAHEAYRGKTVDTRSKVYVALRKRSHWLVESSD